MQKTYYVYIMTNFTNTVLYTGVTNNLPVRAGAHRAHAGGHFAARYNVKKLVYYKEYGDIRQAIQREKQIKGGSRKKKIELIESFNPEWKDLSEEGL